MRKHASSKHLILCAAFAGAALCAPRAARAEEPAANPTANPTHDDRRDTQVRYVQQTLKADGHPAVSTNPGQELFLSRQIFFLRANAGFDLDEPGTRNVPGNIWERGLRLDTLSLEVKTHKADGSGGGVLEFGKLSPQRGYIWRNIVPGWQPLVSGAEASWNLAVPDQVGARADYHGMLGDHDSLRLEASVTRTFPALNGGYSFYHKDGPGFLIHDEFGLHHTSRRGGLSDSWTPTVTGTVEYRRDNVAGGALTLGLDGSDLARGALTEAAEYGFGGHAVWTRPLVPDLTLTSAGEAFDRVNAFGRKGALAPVVAGVSMLEGVIGLKDTWISLHGAVSASYDAADDTRLAAAEAGAAVKLIGTFKAVATVERSERFSGPLAGPATAFQIGGAFSPW